MSVDECEATTSAYLAYILDDLDSPGPNAELFTAFSDHIGNFHEHPLNVGRFVKCVLLR